MNLIQIAERIKKHEKKKNKEAFWVKPEEVKEYTLPEFKIPVSKRQKNLRMNFRRVMTVIEMIKHSRVIGCTRISLSSNSDWMIRLCGGQKQASRLIQLMKEIGILADDCNTYRFGCRQTYSKTYLYFYENEVKFLDYCLDNSINEIVFSVNVNVMSSSISRQIEMSNNERRELPARERFRFSSKLYILKPDNYSEEDFNEYALSCLYENYPTLIEYQRMVDEMNLKYYSDRPEMSIRFKPSFEYDESGRVLRKIGIRATNSLCNRSKEERPKLLEKYGLNLEKDVKSSVPRVTMSLNLGKWVDESIDIYELIYDHLDCEDDFKKTREAIKQLHMRAYFDDGHLGCNTLNAMFGTEEERPEVYRLMNELRQAVREVEGQGYDNEVFYFESILYLEVLKRLLKEGFKVWLVYDAFYASKKGFTQNYESYVREIIKETANLMLAA